MKNLNDLSATGEIVKVKSYTKYDRQVITDILYHDVAEGTNGFYDIFYVVRSTVVLGYACNNKVELRHSYKIDDNGVVRWENNDRVIPADCIEDAMCEFLPEFNRANTDATRTAENDAFLADYRRRNANREYSAEEMLAMRAAFGEGTEVVNVVTGRKVRL